MNLDGLWDFLINLDIWVFFIVGILIIISIIGANVGDEPSDSSANENSSHPREHFISWSGDDPQDDYDRWQIDRNRMLTRDKAGEKLERAGEIEQAIKLYERNVAVADDLFDDSSRSYPYERLRIIYTERKQYDDAIRVCQAFVDRVDMLLKCNISCPNLEAERDKFMEWIGDLEKQKPRQRFLFWEF